ncbi:hypothetical protein ACVWWO_006431 [Bradyrhizobium sp. F1.13.1]
MNRLQRFFQNTYRRIYNWVVPPYATMSVDAVLPKTLKRRALYIVQEDGYQEQAAMICPCGCKAILHMNLLPDERPCWRVTRHQDGSATLYPSVWRKKECGSHFWFRNGRVIWC